jgi:dTMP kinase
VISGNRQVSIHGTAPVTDQTGPSNDEHADVNDQHDDQQAENPSARREAQQTHRRTRDRDQGDEGRHLWEGSRTVEMAVAASDAGSKVAGIVHGVVPLEKNVPVGIAGTDANRSRRLVDLDTPEAGPVLSPDIHVHRANGSRRDGTAPVRASIRDFWRYRACRSWRGASYLASMHDWTRILTGRFIVFDGPDGSGKSTQLAKFTSFCNSHGVVPVEVREPGGTPIGEAIRGVLLDPRYEEMDLRCEMLLYMASRSQLMDERIRPALAEGRFVLADRFISSTLAYQGTAGGLDPEEIMAVGRVATRGCEPDLVVIFDVDEATAAGRLPAQLDRMELKGSAFHRRVRQGYLAQAQRAPDRHLVIDATADEDSVFQAMLEGLGSHLSGLAG